MSDLYDRAYFDKWYRDPNHRISTRTTAARKAAVAVSIAEYYLGRHVRSVLDVGCGEGQWRAILKKMRPGLRYTGIDSSPYVVKRFGRSRNLRLGSFGSLPKLAASYDLIVCSDLLYYVPEDQLSKGLATLAAHLGGVAFLEAYSSDEELVGDTVRIDERSSTFYRRIFGDAGLIACGTHCYLGPALWDRLTELETACPRPTRQRGASAKRSPSKRRKQQRA